jgi:hypothetical protein
MKLTRFGGSAVAAGLMLLACGESGPNDNRCDVALTFQVTPGSTPVFSWSPACTVAQLRVVKEAEGDDPEVEVWSVVASGNTIAGPVTYGVAPAGSTETTPEVLLTIGDAYRLVVAVRNPETGVLLVGGLYPFTP